MKLWHVSSDTETGGYTHVLAAGGGHALLLPVVTSVFQDLRVSASLCDGTFWWPIHSEPDLIPFETARNVETKRWDYNGRMFAEAIRARRVRRGEHLGWSDLFVPVWMAGEPVAMLVVGPFGTSRPTGASILSRWRSLTGQHGHLADAEFAAYLRTTLSTLVLEEPALAAFTRLMHDLGRLMAGSGRADAIANRASALRLRLGSVRLAENMWQAAHAMVDERWSKLQWSAGSADSLSRLGLMHAADQVVVGLAASLMTVDPVDDVVRRDALSRAAVELARAEGSVIAGRIGDRGVTFLFGAAGTAKAKKERVERLIARTASLARRRFGLSLHFGASLAPGPPLNERYQTARGAAEMALTQGKRVLVSEELGERPVSSLRLLRARLTRAAEERPALLAAEFDRYLEAVVAVSGYRIEPARAQVEIGFESLANTLLRSGALDPKSFAKMCDRLDRAAAHASTTGELFAAYRLAATEMAEAASRPVTAGQQRGLHRALEYVEQHYRERLGIEKVARVAGFASSYFSELFKKHEKKTFKKHLQKLRLERAKQLLTGTDLSVIRVADLSGHGSPQYLSRVFRRALGVTPLEYRRARLPEWFRKRRKTALTRTHGSAC